MTYAFKEWEIFKACSFKLTVMNKQKKYIGYRKIFYLKLKMIKLEKVTLPLE